MNSAYRSCKTITGLGLCYAAANKVISSSTFFLNREKRVGRKANVCVTGGRNCSHLAQLQECSS